jgi:ligand-binding sensor protein/putative methionine-R-sulfoxide reductase with GAF domain
MPGAVAPCFVELDELGRQRRTSGFAVAATAKRTVPTRMLVELIGAENLQAIQHAFATAFDIPTVILDDDGFNVNEITHRVAFCEDHTRPSGAGPMCLRCDRRGMSISAQTHRPTIFHCWAKLWDCTIPIVSSQGELFGYFLSGQVFFEPQTDLGRYRRLAAQHGLDTEAYLNAVRAVRVMDADVYRRGIECIAVLARMIADQASAALRHRELLDTLLSANAQTRRLVAELDAIANAASQLGTAEGGEAAMARLCDALERVIPFDSVIVLRVESDGLLRPVMVRDPYAKPIAAWTPAIGSGFAGTVAASGEALRIADARAHPLFTPIDGVPVEAESVVALPLEHAGQVIGVLQIGRLERSPFSEHEADLLRILSPSFALALGSASQQRELQRMRAAADAQHQVLERLASSASLAELADLALSRAESLLGPARGVLRIIDDDAGGHLAGLHLPPEGQAEAIRRARDAIHRSHERLQLSVTHDGDDQLVVCPLHMSGESIGEMLLWPAKPASPADIELLDRFAHQLAAALGVTREKRRVRFSLAQSTRLATLVRNIRHAVSRPAVAEQLVRAHELISGGLETVVVLASPFPGMLELWRRGEHRPVARSELPVAGRPELRLPAPSDPLEEPGLIAAWGQRLIAQLPDVAAGDVSDALALSADGAQAGAVLVVGSRPPAPGGHATLEVLRWAADAALERIERSEASQAAAIRRSHSLVAAHEIALRLAPLAGPDEVARAICDELRSLADAEAVALIQRSGPRAPVVLAAVPARDRTGCRLLAERWCSVAEPVHEDGQLLISLTVNDGAECLLCADRCRRSVDPDALRIFAAHAAHVLGNAREHAAARAIAAEQERELASLRTSERSWRETVDAGAELLSASLDANGLSLIAGIVARSTGAAAAIYGTDGRRLAGGDAFPDELPGLVELSADDGCVTLASGHASPIAPGGELLGWLLEAPGGRRLEPAIQAAAASSAAVALGRDRAADLAEARVRGDYVEALLASDEPSAALLRRGRALGHDATAPHEVAVVSVQDTTGAELVELCRRSLRDLQGVLLTARADEVVLIGPEGGRWIDRVQDALSTTGPSRIGVGGSTAGAGYRASYAGASRAVAALQHLGRTGMIRIDGDGVEQLLLRATAPEHLTAFVRRVLEPLREYDRRRSSDLRRTLELCISHTWNLEAAARSAHIHHSTLRYRLERISTLTGLDPREAEDRLAFQLALLADRLLGAEIEDRPASRTEGDLPPRSRG